MRAQLGLVVLLLCVARSALAEGGVGTSVELDRDSVVVHEQVVLDVVVTHEAHARARWVPPAFDGFWVEKLDSRSRRPGRTPEGGHTRTSVFRRALFPTRAGMLEIPASKVELIGRDGEKGELAVPGTRLAVEALPAPAEGERASDLVGDLTIRSTLRKPRVELGSALPLTVEVFGSANVWDLRPLELEARLDPQVEAFEVAPRTSIGETAGRATTRRTLRFDLVPRSIGRYEVPALEVPYFDTLSRRYTVARSEAVSFEAVPALATERAPWENVEVLEPRRGVPWTALGLVAVVALLTALWLRRWGARSQARLAVPTVPSQHAAFESARAALGGERFNAELARAVKAGIQRRHGLDPRPLTTDEIAARLDDPEALALLRELDDARYRGAPIEPEPLLARVRAYLEL